LAAAACGGGTTATDLKKLDPRAVVAARGDFEDIV
jgi:hypothetical protein